jgi:hypothetical protein
MALEKPPLGEQLMSWGWKHWFEKLWLHVKDLTVGGGGSGAPTDATYVTLSTNPTLTNERVLTAGSGITVTDGGAGGNVTIASTVTSGAPVDPQYLTLATNATLTNERVLTPGAGITGSDGGAGGAYTLTVDHGGGGLPWKITRRKYAESVPAATGAIFNRGWNTLIGGTWGGVVQATTSRINASVRYRGATGAATNATASCLWQNHELFRGNGTVTGGFRFEIVWGLDTSRTDARFFVGLWGANSSMISGTSEPSAAGDADHVIGICLDSTDTQLQLLKNDAGVTAVKTSLGASWPRPAVTDVFRLSIYCDSSASSITWVLENLITGASTSATETTDIPGTTANLWPLIVVNSGPTVATAMTCSVYGAWADTPVI